MDTDTRYRRTVELLKKAGHLQDGEEIERKVISRLLDSQYKQRRENGLFDFLFGWAEIVWVRRSLTIASFILIALFVYQQSVITRQLNTLSSEILFDKSEPGMLFQPDRITRYQYIKASSGSIDPVLISAPDEQTRQIMKSYEELLKNYESLLKIIENDPQLRRVLNESLSETDSDKIKL